MDQTNIQVLFFQHLRTQLASHLSLVDEIADLLSISNDSAYRRIRGEKPISFEELQKLCSHFRLSLDQFLHIKNNSVIFNGNNADHDHFTFENYLNGVLQQLQLFNSYSTKEMFYLCKDMPFFHHCLFPELGAFKFFFWIRSILQYPEYAKQTFSIEALSPVIRDLTAKVGELYTVIPSQEIWNVESINSTIRQIDYYRNTRSFTTMEDYERLLIILEKALDHIEQETELGYKFFPGDAKKIKRAPYKVYLNEFILGDNTVFVKLDNNMISFVNHSVINFMYTKDLSFNSYMDEHIKRLIKKSTLISEVGEKERTRFFNMMKEKINSRKNALLH